MHKITLLYAKNLITRKAAAVRQELSFLLLVENLAFVKRVDVVWTGEEGPWRTLPAHYHSTIDEHQEYWLARMAFTLGPDESLPGNVQFAVRYQTSGVECWDNNHGENYSIQADSGILVDQQHPVLNVEFESNLTDGQSIVPVAVAVDSSLHVKRVTVHWTSDEWKTTHKTHCRFRRNYWDSEFLSNARNPNHYGRQIWQATLKVDDAFRVRYKISCETRQRVLWDDNFGNSHAIQRRPLKVLVLNLHCCQEDNQDYKLSLIAEAINALEVDIICLQEVAELWNNGKGDWQTNTARIINERLASPYHLVTDWSHLGFARYREGVAILSRYPIEKHAARYVSASHDPYSIHSRKVVMGQIRVPHVGLLNVFSSHLSWWDDGFPAQFEALRQWAAAEHGAQVAATLLGGDFNIKAGSSGYQLVANTHEYDDQYLSATSPQVFRRIFEARDPAWQHSLDDDHRIDFVFLRKGSNLRVTSGRTVFTDQDYGTVSDHCGYLMTFEPK